MKYSMRSMAALAIMPAMMIALPSHHQTIQSIHPKTEVQVNFSGSAECAAPGNVYCWSNAGSGDIVALTDTSGLEYLAPESCTSINVNGVATEACEFVNAAGLCLHSQTSDNYYVINYPCGGEQSEYWFRGNPGCSGGGDFFISVYNSNYFGEDEEINAFSVGQDQKLYTTGPEGCQDSSPENQWILG